MPSYWALPASTLKGSHDRIARMWMEEAAPRVNNTRYDQLMETGAKTVAVSCPFCMTMIDDANKNAGHEDVKVYDVIELVDKALVRKQPTA